MGWGKPPKDWMKLNTDGSVTESTRMSGSGGLIRNKHGTWIQCFMTNLGCCSIEEVQLWATPNGLKLAWAVGSKMIF